MTWITQWVSVSHRITFACNWQSSTELTKKWMDLFRKRFSSVHSPKRFVLLNELFVNDNTTLVVCLYMLIPLSKVIEIAQSIFSCTRYPPFFKNARCNTCLALHNVLLICIFMVLFNHCLTRRSCMFRTLQLGGFFVFYLKNINTTNHTLFSKKYNFFLLISNLALMCPNVCSTYTQTAVK